VRHTDRLPVELGGDAFEVISLPDIFGPERSGVTAFVGIEISKYRRC